MPSTRGKPELKLLYDMTRSLDVRYRFNDQQYESASLKLPGAETHANLANACNKLISLRKETYTKDISDINLATAAVTLLYTDTQTEEGHLGEDVKQSCYYIHAEIPERIVSTKSFYTNTYQLTSLPKKGLRDNGFNQLLSDRVIAFSNISHNYDCDKVKMARGMFLS